MKTLVSFLALAVGLAFAPMIAHAQTVSPVPVPTIITTAPITISKPGYYQLGANLFYAGNSNVDNDAIITINASNVTLDFAGHYISGPSNTPGSTLYGVYAHEEGNLIIRNGTVAFCEIGIYLSGSGQTGSLNINQTVQNMLVSYCYIVGIEFDFPSNSALVNNRVSFIGGGSTYATGILVDSGTGNKAVGNTITNVTATEDNSYGIGGGNGTSLAALNNTVSNVTANGGVGTGIGGTTFTVNNTIQNCQYGVYSGGKYMGNLTSGCTTPFSGGTPVGVNH